MTDEITNTTTANEAIRIREEEIQDSVKQEKTSMGHDSGSSRQGVESRLTAEPWPVVDKWYADFYRSPYQVKVTDYGNAFVAEDGGDVIEASELFDTEPLAIDAAKKYAKEQEAFWYARIQALDKRIEEIELKEQDDESNARR